MVNWAYSGEYTKEFEEKLKPWVGTKYVIATNSGTAALHLCLMALEINQGHIITQALTFIATANIIKYQGCFPIFLDVDKNQCLSVSELNKYFKQKCYFIPQAIIPVHLNRNIGDQKGLCKIAKKHKIPVIEDACQALGIWKLQGDCGAVSFNGNKIITTGGGGAFCTNRKDLYERAYQIVNIGRKKNSDFHEIIGYNYRQPSLNARRGIEELEKLPDYLKNKKPRERNMQVPLTEFPPYKQYHNFPLPMTYKLSQTCKGLEFINE
jgi:perosamine synthetase